jgi:HAD superfamily hydrolase (TIGR01450 family)
MSAVNAPQGSSRPLLDVHDLLILDLDGVVYVGAHAVPGVVEVLEKAEARGVRRTFATNNASRTPEDVAAHLSRIGVPAQPQDVVTSSQAAADLIVRRCGAGVSVLAVGGPGLVEACREAGLNVVVSAEDSPAAVVQGYGPAVGWRDLAEATYAVRAGSWWVATNTDITIPTERGPAPGNGTLVAAVRAAVDVDPVVAGKPEPGLFTAAARRVGARSPLVVGDRLDTDIEGAVRAQQPSVLVLTGVTRPQDLLDAEPGRRPTYVTEDMHGLLEPQPEVTADGDGWRCRDARVEVVAGELQGSAPQGRGAALDLLRAAAAAAWASQAAGEKPSVASALLERWEPLGTDPTT